MVIIHLPGPGSRLVNEMRAAHPQKCCSVCTRNCTRLILLSPLKGNARSTCTTLPRPERELPKRRPKPASLRSPRPGAAGVEEHRGAHAKQPERVPVGEEALFHGPQRPCRAVLVTQGIAAQPIVAAKQDLVLEIQPPPLGRLQRREGQPVLVLFEVVAHRAREQHIARLAVLEPAGEGAGEQQRRAATVAEPAARGALQYERAAARAERRVRPAEAHTGGGAEVEVLGARDLVVVPELQIIILHQVELYPRVQEAPIVGDRGHAGPGADRLEAVLIVGDAGAPAAYPAVLQSL